MVAFVTVTDQYHPLGTSRVTLCVSPLTPICSAPPQSLGLLVAPSAS